MRDDFTWSEEFKYQCMVRHVLQMRINSRKDALALLRRWEKKHKNTKLEDDVRRQWFRGNRGQPNDWRLI
jgi:hypothetical protein